jgi:hypothetical protein
METMLQQVNLAINILFLPNYLWNGLESDDWDKGSSISYCYKIVALSMDDLYFI